MKVQLGSDKIHVLNIVGEPVGGIRRHVHSIMRRLDPHHFDISYSYSTVSTDEVFSAEFDFLRPRLKAALPLVIKKKPSVQDVTNLLTLLRFVRSQRVSVVHGHGAKGGAYARLLKMFSGVAAVYTPHGGVLHDAFSAAEKFFYRGVERQLMRFTDMLVFESHYSKNAYWEKIGYPSCPVIVNYNGVARDSIRLTGTIPSQLTEERRAGFHVGIFARLHPMKGQSIAIEAVHALQSDMGFCSTGTVVYLHLFGSGPSEFSLRSFVAAKRLEGQVIFHGDVNNPEEIMSYLDAVLIPSRFESFSYVAAEALMVGVPVIAASIGGLQEVLADGAGLLVEGANPAGFALALKALAADADLRNRLVVKGHSRYLEHFQEERMITNLAGLYAKFGMLP